MRSYQGRRDIVFSEPYDLVCVQMSVCCLLPEGIEAVLNLKKHDYLYMCAKEDFSGTHNFARTYSEHMANAAKYTKALNQRGIK